MTRYKYEPRHITVSRPIPSARSTSNINNKLNKPRLSIINQDFKTTSIRGVRTIESLSIVVVIKTLHIFFQNYKLCMESMAPNICIFVAVCTQKMEALNNYSCSLFQNLVYNLQLLGHTLIRLAHFDYF